MSAQNAGFKLGQAENAGKLSASSPSSSKPQSHLYSLAAEHLEDCSSVRGVSIRSPLRVTVEPGETVVLSGHINCDTNLPADVKLLQRPADFFPSGLNVECNLCGHTVSVEIKNSGRKSFVIDHRTVFAELHSNSNPKTDFEALIGPTTTAPVELNTISANCLIDSGSQVSIMSETFYNDNFSDLTIEDLSSPLRVVGAGGNCVPYLGYVQIDDVKLSESVSGVSESVGGLFLICPDTEFSHAVPVLIGTNILRNFADLCQRQFGVNYAKSVRACSTVSFFYNDHVLGNDGKVGSVKVRCPKLVVPAGETVEVKCSVYANIPSTRNSVLLTESADPTLPEGVKVVACKVSVDCLHDIKMVIVNETDDDICLKKSQIVADVFVYESEYNVRKLVEDFSMKEDENVTVSGSVAAGDPPTVGKKEINFNFDEETLKNHPDWCEAFKKRLETVSNAFVAHEYDIGGAKTGEVFDINLTPGPDIRSRARPLNPRDFEDTKIHIQNLLDAGIIRPSNSPFASPIVVCRKRSGKIRMCVDYRLLNARTVRDSFQIPVIESLMFNLSGAKFFTTLDLCQAYYQIPMTERACKYSAFITPFGVFEFDRLSQGLCNAPSCFQRIMETVFSDMNLTELIIFLDDILCYGNTLEQLEERTMKVLHRLCRFNLKLDPKKCVFGATKVTHLGYVISEGTIQPDPAKVAVVKDWPTPQTVKDVKKFIGFTGFYRRFIPSYSALARPLNDLTIGYAPGSKKKLSKGQKKVTLATNITSLWGEAQERSFRSLIEMLTSDLVLRLAEVKTVHSSC